ncbi:Levanase precursor [compost metagenome]
MSEFGGQGFQAVWECPDLFQLPVDGDPNHTKWVLSISVQSGAPAQGSGMQYFIGHFDGTRFINDNPGDMVLWTDFGADFYAGITWDNVPDGKRFWVSWMNNWSYAVTIPTGDWRSSTSIPRELSLINTASGIRMVQKPIKELSSLRCTEIEWLDQTITPGSNLLSEVNEHVVEIVAEFQTDTATADEFGLRFRKGNGQFTTVAYDRMNSKLFVDRTLSGVSDFYDAFAAKHEATLFPENNIIRMHIYLDSASVEVFGNEGRTVITDQIFPDQKSNIMELYSIGGDVVLNVLRIYPLKKAVFTRIDE